MLLHALLLVLLVVPGAVVSTTIMAGPASAECRMVDQPPPRHLQCGGSEEDPGGPGDDDGPGNPGDPGRVPYDTFETPACMTNGPPPGGGDAMCMGATASCEAQGGGTRMRIYYQWEQNGPWELIATRCVGGEEDEPTPPTPDQIRTVLIDRYLPKGGVGTSPPDGRTLVGLDTIFFTDAAQSYNATVDILGTPVTINATAKRWVWHAGDTTFESTKPGSAYTAGKAMSAYVTHKYTEAADNYNLSVDIVWDVEYTMAGQTAQLGDLPVAGTETTPLTVLEAESRITG